ncbi:hypothetical protein HNP77_002201 [Treponema rectale]|uniref:Uncharacterized protein n=1 Tax=Treponema rectale TaxID=744512 RepID=A0A840SKE1_9SPIR|nr:hypothetical protein [Treponema rectale]
MKDVTAKFIRSKIASAVFEITSIYPPRACVYSHEFQSSIISGLFIRIDEQFWN